MDGRRIAKVKSQVVEYRGYEHSRFKLNMNIKGICKVREDSRYKTKEDYHEMSRRNSQDGAK